MTLFASLDNLGLLKRGPSEKEFVSGGLFNEGEGEVYV